MSQHLTEQHYDSIKEHLKMCNVVHVHYPELYLSLVESDIQDQTFRAQIAKLHKEIQAKNTGR